MGLRFDPVGGGQLKQALKQIIEAESQPLLKLEARKALEESKMKLFQDFKTKFSGIEKTIDGMANFQTFREFKVDLGDGQNIASVTVDKDKVFPGSYRIEVEQLAARTSIISNGLENPDDASIGMGFIVMNLPDGTTSEIFVDANDASLNGIANLINRQSDAPVRAAVLKDMSEPNTPYKLIITAKQDGKQNQIDFPEFYFLDGANEFYVDDDVESQNAIVKIDGFAMELESNDVKDFLPGVNLHIKQANPDQPFNLNITEDHQKIAGKVKELVDEVNGVLKFILQQNTINEKSDTRSTFAGDTGLQTVEFRLRNLLHEGFAVPDNDNEYRLVFLNQIGIEFDKTGLLSFKEDKFTKFMEQDFEGMSQAITGDFGFAFQLKEVIKGYTQPTNGLLALREQGLRSRIREIDNQIDQKTRLLERRQQSLTEQFSRLQGSLGNLQKQQQYLSATLPSGGGGNLVSQLLGG